MGCFRFGLDATHPSGTVNQVTLTTLERGEREGYANSTVPYVPMCSGRRPAGCSADRLAGRRGWSARHEAHRRRGTSDRTPAPLARYAMERRLRVEKGTHARVGILSPRRCGRSRWTRSHACEFTRALAPARELLKREPSATFRMAWMGALAVRAPPWRSLPGFALGRLAASAAGPTGRQRPTKRAERGRPRSRPPRGERRA